MADTDSDFPCSLVISIPLPTHRLASFALRALQVDLELSPLVQRSFTLVSPERREAHTSNDSVEGSAPNGDAATGVRNENNPFEEKTVLRTEYKATTNRMLRVSVNGFLESMGVVLEAMEELDVDVLAEEQRLAQA
ncbi:MAG: hypothetical protein Q9207_004698 [Kuettlingeria erythrocarpa]